MRSIVKVVVALVLVTSGLLAGGAPGAQANAQPQLAAKTARSIVMVFTPKRSTDGFHVKAGISPDFRSRVATLQYKRHVKDTFQRIRTARSNDAGVVRFPMKVRKLGFYRVTTPEDALHIRSGSNIIQVQQG